MQEFCKNAEVVRIFKDAALQRSLPFVHSASTGMYFSLYKFIYHQS